MGGDWKHYFGGFSSACLARMALARARPPVDAGNLGPAAAKGYEGGSLTVTAENHSAVRLFRDLDFQVIKEFTAYAHNLPAPEASSIPTAGVEFTFLISSFDSSSAVSGSSGISLQLFQQGLEARMAAQ